MLDSYRQRKEEQLLALVAMLDESISRVEYIRNRPVRGDMVEPCTEAIRHMHKAKDILNEVISGVRRREDKADPA